MGLAAAAGTVAVGAAGAGSAAIGAGLAAAGTIGSAAISSKASKKASKAAQAAADQSAQVQREIYGENKEILSPYTQRGNTAGNYLNAFLGIPGQTVAPPTPANGNILSGGMANIPGIGWVQIPNGGTGANWQAALGGQVPQPAGTTAVPANGVLAQSVTPGDAQGAFRSFIQNSDYGFQFGEGSNAVNSGYAGAGTLQSGDAMRALEDYRQNLQSGYRGEYLGLLGNQQGVGAVAGSALSGVGQNYANSLGNIYTAAGDAKANAALSRAANNPFNALTGIGGTILGSKL